MEKYECAQKMILDLVLRHGCEVKIRPYGYGREMSRITPIEIVISKDEYHSATVIDLSPPYEINVDEMVCRQIERTAMALFKRPYEETMSRFFGGENDYRKEG